MWNELRGGVVDTINFPHSAHRGKRREGDDERESGHARDSLIRDSAWIFGVIFPTLLGYWIVLAWILFSGERVHHKRADL